VLLLLAEVLLVQSISRGHNVMWLVGRVDVLLRGVTRKCLLDRRDVFLVSVRRRNMFQVSMGWDVLQAGW
jgi:hypothetical protein